MSNVMSQIVSPKKDMFQYLRLYVFTAVIKLK